MVLHKILARDFKLINFGWNRMSQRLFIDVHSENCRKKCSLFSLLFLQSKKY